MVAWERTLSFAAMNRMFCCLFVLFGWTGTLSLDAQRDLPIDIGDPVYAVGTPYDQGLDATVTRGIISGRRGKGIEQRLQTDVPISPGNSGGALLDEEGRWVGVVNAKLVAMEVDGIGFAIPSEALPRALRVKLD